MQVAQHLQYEGAAHFSATHSRGPMGESCKYCRLSTKDTVLWNWHQMRPKPMESLGATPAG